MSEPTPTFAGEVQLRRWSESSTQGVQVTFALADSANLDKFKGLDGKRFMAVLVQIGDDEQPVSSDIGNPTSGKPREPLGDLCWRTVNWCRDPEFQNWIAQQVGFAMDMPIGEEYAKQCVLRVCGVTSRKQLDEVPLAGRKCRERIVGPYQKHLIARGIVR